MKHLNVVKAFSVGTRLRYHSYHSKYDEVPSSAAEALAVLKAFDL